MSDSAWTVSGLDQVTRMEDLAVVGQDQWRPRRRVLSSLALADAAATGHLSRAPLLRDFRASDFDMLLANSHWKAVERGTTLTLSGSRPSHAWLLLTGFVKEHRTTSDGMPIVCAFRGPGDLVGEVGALTGHPAASDSTLLTAGEVLALPVAGLGTVARHSERLQRALVRSLALRAAAAEDALARNENPDVAERVASGVLWLAERWGVPTTAGIRIGLPLTQAELASWLGISRETVAKALARMRHDGAVSTSRRRLIVHDLGYLHDMTGPRRRGRPGVV